MPPPFPFAGKTGILKKITPHGAARVRQAGRGKGGTAYGAYLGLHRCWRRAGRAFCGPEPSPPRQNGACPQRWRAAFGESGTCGKLPWHARRDGPRDDGAFSGARLGTGRRNPPAARGQRDAHGRDISGGRRQRDVHRARRYSGVRRVKGGPGARRGGIFGARRFVLCHLRRHAVPSKTCGRVGAFARGAGRSGISAFHWLPGNLYCPQAASGAGAGH